MLVFVGWQVAGGVPVSVFPWPHEWTGLLQAKGQKQARGLTDQWLTILKNPKPTDPRLASGCLPLILLALGGWEHATRSWSLLPKHGLFLLRHPQNLPAS